MRKSQVPLNKTSPLLNRRINEEHIMSESAYNMTFWNTIWLVILEQTTTNNECKLKK